MRTKNRFLNWASERGVVSRNIGKRRSRFGRRGITFVIAMLLIIPLTCAQATNIYSAPQSMTATEDKLKPSNVVDNQGPYSTLRPPFNVSDFWANVMSLIRKQDGYVAPSLFETTFGVKFKHSRDLGSDSMIYWLDYGTDWYMNVSLNSFYKGMESWIDLRWHVNTFGDYSKGECVDIDRATKDVVDSGWKPGLKERGVLVFDEYIKHGNRLEIDFAGRCVHSIKFGGKR
jgi:hypothetical protein